MKSRLMAEVLEEVKQEEVKSEPRQYATQEAEDFDKFFEDEVSEDKAPVKKEEAKSEEKTIEVSDEQKAEMQDFQSLIDKGYDNLDDEEKAKYDDYSKRYETQDEEKKEEEKKDPESWKDYNEEDLIKKIENEEDITDDQIEFLRSKGHKIEVEEVKSEEKQTQEEEKKPEEKKEEPKIPSYVSDLKKIDAFSDRKFETVEEAERGVQEYIEMQEDKDRKLMDILSKNPELTGVIGDLAKGKDAAEAIKAHFEDLFNEEAPKPGEDGYEEYILEKHRRKQALVQENERKKIFAENQQKSVDNAARFVKSKELPEDKAREYFQSLDSHITNLSSGIVTEDLMDLVYKGLNYDKLKEDNKKAVEDAEKRGEIKGANRKIHFERHSPKDDGIRRVKRKAAREIKEQVNYASEDAKTFDDFLNS